MPLVLKCLLMYRIDCESTSHGLRIDLHLSLFEVNGAAEVIRQAVDPEANIIFGVTLDTNLENEVRLTLIATGFASKEAMIGAGRDKEMTRLLKNLKTEEELAIPAFMRQRLSLSKQHPGTTNPPHSQGY